MSIGSSSDSVHACKIQCADAVNFVVGRTQDEKQVILGVPGTFLAAVFFDLHGNMLMNETRPQLLATLAKTQQAHKTNRKALANLWESLDSWKSEIGFVPFTINVNRFFITELDLGIADLPHYLQDFLSNPASEADENFRQELFAEVSEWHRQGKFVLRWGNEYWMNSDGEVTDT